MIKNSQEKFFTLSEFRHEVGIPLVLAKKLIVWGEIEAEHAVDGTLRIAQTEAIKIAEIIKNPWKKTYYFFRALGPGVITGASDDDPSGIGTYSSVGAKFGLGLLWMAAWLLPMMMAIQEACARIGIVTNHGLAGVLKKHYRRKTVIGITSILIVANVINIGADLGAMAKSLQMLTNINFYVATIFFAVTIIMLEIFIGYHIYVKILKWLAVSVLAYIVTAIIIHPNWNAIFESAIIPKISFTSEYIFAMVAVFGTSITPYLFFWQTSEEVEENKLAKKIFRSLRHKDNRVMTNRIAQMRTDVETGMILANAVFFFIIVTTSQVLFENGIFNIDSAEQAALALKPLAGDYAYLLFAFGIIGTGLLAVPILAGSGAYALAETMNWREGLEEKFSRAKGFYAVIIVSILVGLFLNFFHINPITALYYSAFLNGVISLPLLVAIMIISDNKKIMGRETNPMWVRISGWFSIIFISGAIISAGILYFI
ncbi:MAG: NRAMP family Mn2+/Fe2+ transporter [Candidatus Moranbacteria bacterium GW2011_GWF2_36_839]|nr:MAG: NRAMP family Mn2+/Fe2+ transporter [Candidatus Moranbacteria bacterium GW2011_GWF1_36_78]KKQ16774.1 MAG: NRAMP family Mn2+/Fe2+ transporter [Candidatus Moranbacteria bacterium GW2011_GWF2_36_839]HAT73580.1 iron transporter [Candidatus Moranbacteria bacterium]HBY10609.1 iron transporter [Candidatus Moranbacteria bacterium]